MRPRWTWAAGVVLGLAACSDSTSVTTPVPEDHGRPETQKLRAADAAGYDGKALQHSVDKMLDTRDQHNGDLNKAADANEAPTAP